MESKMFKSLIIYNMSEDLSITEEDLNKQMPALAFKPCGSQDLKSTGWVAPLNGSPELFFAANGHILLHIKTEEKILPAGVIKDYHLEKIEQFEEREGRKCKKTEKDTLKDEVIHELLPRAFSKFNIVPIWINPAKKMIMVEAGSSKKAEDALALLRKTLGSLPVTPFTTESPIEYTLTEWVRDSKPAEGFVVLDEAELKAVLDEGGVIQSKKQDLASDEIQNHIEAGKFVTKLALDWQGKITFLITNDGLLKRIKLGDAITSQSDDIDKEDFAQKFASDFTIATGELSQMISDIVLAFNSPEDAKEEGDSDSE